MTYSVKEIFYTLQGEGAHAGCPAVFCRFSGCNLWTGREEDRTGAICTFCDTDFIGTNGENGGKFSSADALAEKVASLWPEIPSSEKRGFVVCTGGEPLLQLDSDLVKAFHTNNFFIAVETNGTQIPPDGIDWLCVSPKIGSTLVVKKGSELKLVYPQVGGDPSQFELLDFERFYLQPMDGDEQEKNISLAVEYCKKHPQWRLSLQTHKILNIP